MLVKTAYVKVGRGEGRVLVVLACRVTVWGQVRFLPMVLGTVGAFAGAWGTRDLHCL